MILTASNYGAMYEGVLPIANFDECSDVVPADFSGYSLIEACYKILEEDATNWNNMIQSAAMLELQYLKENGVEIVYEEEEMVGEKGSWLSKAKAAVTSWLSKILGMIKNAGTTLMSHAANALKNIGVSQKLTTAKWPEGKSFTTPDYFKARQAVDAIDLIKNFSVDGEGSDTLPAELAAAIKKASGKDGSCSSTDIKKHMLADKSLTVNGNVKYDACIQVLNAYKSEAKAIREMQKEAKDTANAILKRLNLSKKAFKEDSKSFGVAIKLLGKINAFNTNLVTAKLSIHIGEVMLASKIAAVYTRAAGVKAVKDKAGDTSKAVKDKAGEAADAVKGAKDKAGDAIKKNVAKVTKSDAKDDKAATKAAAKDVKESAISRIPDVEIV